MKKLTLLFIAILLIAFPKLGVSQTGAFTFTLSATATTSAGVYKIDSTLVRTLWSTVKYNAGSHTEYWDGKDDNGVAITSPAANYIIKVVSNNVNYTWQGIVGNSSDSITGASVHKGLYHCMTGMVFANNGYGYFCRGYSEGHSSLAKLSTANPQSKIDILQGSGSTFTTDFVATDNTNVYWSGVDSYSTNNTMVHATKVSNDSEVNFANGVSYNNTYGRTFPSVISKLNQTNSIITGLAVQKTGNKLFVARAGLNQLQVLDKSTGALLQTLTYTTPKALTVDGNDNLWMVSGTNTVAKYTVNTNGTLTSATLTLTGLIDPLAVQVSYDGTIVTVADGSTSQQVKFFNNTTGALTKTMGTAGGYTTDATVSNTKFYFNDARGNKPTFIAYQPDNSFWINDDGNFRAMHFSSNGTFIDRIMSLGAGYSSYIDRNDITRVFSEFLEFKIDYSVQTLTGSTGWTLAKNWGANIGNNYDLFQKFHYPTTLSNGRTYAFLRVANTNNFELIELISGGTTRATGILKPDYPLMAADGSLIVSSGGGPGNMESINKYTLTGFNGSNNPQWSSTPILVAKTPVLTIKDPQGGYAISGNKVFFFNSDVFLNGSVATPFDGYHLGGMAIGGNKWLWKTEQATHINYAGVYPGAGYFDIGNTVNQYAGSTINAIDRNVITGYHGEFWKQSQTNKYNHYLDNGLAIGQFGTTGPETTGEVPAMMAGNALSPVVVKDANGDLYLWHGDESVHAGVHRWKITNLNSIAEQNMVIPYPSAYTPATMCYVDLMKGLPFDAVITDGTAGWNRTPTTESSNWSIKTNKLKYDKLTSPDVFVHYSQTGGGQCSLTKDLGNNNVSNSWELSGEISFQGNMPNTSIAQYFDVLDNTGKVLCHFYTTINFSNNTANYYFNNKTVAITNEMGYGHDGVGEKLQPFDIKVVNGVLTFKYANFTTVTATLSDLSANWKTPKTIKIYFTPGSPDYGKEFGMKDFKLYIDATQCGVTTGIDKQEDLSSAVNIYPNPTSGNFTMEFELAQNEKTDVQIVNAMGQIIKSETHNFVIGNNELSFDLSNYTTGIYFIELRTSSNVIVKRIAKN